MDEVLRGEWKFPGFIVSDWLDIERLKILHKNIAQSSAYSKRRCAPNHRLLYGHAYAWP
jgi:beta-glucosidase-like glycosyl hydrolase